MKSLTIENLKGLKNTGEINLKPITIFVGQNSYGKSSLIRTFPLFKQSSESKTTGTILWSGKYVDYGSFHESLNKEALINNDNQIRFIFEIDTPNSLLRSNQYSNSSSKIKVTLHDDEYSETNYTEITYQIFNNEIIIRYSSSLKILKVLINNQDYTKQAIENFVTYKSYSILPVLFPREIQNQGNTTANYFNTLKNYVHHRTSNNTIRKIINAIQFGTDENIRRYLTSKALVGEHAAPKFKSLQDNHPDFLKIKNEIIFLNLRRITDSFSDTFTSTFRNSRYITPLRAAADRYYRIKNISIDELDPNGSNLAMFLYSKKQNEIENINKWLKESVGFSISIETFQGHVSIFIHDDFYKENINIADTGFGISQVLPILIEIWERTNQKIYRNINSTKTTIIVIEQPELHLHPKMQYRIGSLFCKAISLTKEKNIDLKIILETHSKEIIDSIGNSIDKKIINNDDVGIYVVDKRQNKNVTESFYDSEGFLENWPYGFFNGA